MSPSRRKGSGDQTDQVLRPGTVSVTVTDMDTVQEENDNDRYVIMNIIIY